MILNKAREFIVPRVRNYALTPVYWNSVLQTSQLVKKVYGITLSVEYNFYIDGMSSSVIPKDEWIEAGEYVADRLINKKGYFENIEDKTKKAKQEILAFLKEINKENLTELSNKNLIGLAGQIFNLFSQYDAASVFAWFVAGDTLKHKIGECLGLKDEDLDIISLPEKQTFASQMEREIIEAALKKGAVSKVAQVLYQKYFWVPFGYDGPTTWDIKYFVERIENYKENLSDAKSKYSELKKRDALLNKKLKIIYKKIEKSNENVRLIHILRSTAVWTDERKMLEFQLFFWYRNILLEFDKRFIMPVKNLQYLFTHELRDIDNHYVKLRKISTQRIGREFMTISTNSTIRIATNREMNEIKKIVDKQAKTSEICGNVASRGPKLKYTAAVKVLRSSSECNKVMPGEILVATMTTPDYTPAMDRALGFITDEGGVTCHAAIVAREMNKPCIIGTRIATQVLKDGDIVEVNASNGVVRKI